METPQIPHVLILPFPAQGHIKPMLRLAELLCRAGFQITFINSDHNHDQLRRFSDLTAFSDRFPSFRFKSIPDGLPSDDPRSGPHSIDLFSSTRNVTKPEFRELLISISQERGRRGAPTCIIADGIMSFAVDVAEEIGIPIITFRTYSACCTWTYFHLSKLSKEGIIPIGGDEDMDQPVTCIPGLENLLRLRDLPGICRLEAGEPVIEFFINETSTMARASALILDTFDGLEAPMITKLGLFFNKIYTIGPLHALFKSCITKPSPSASSSTIGCLWKEDRSCLKWLDSQPLRSVIYVSFGSVVGIVPDQLLEFWYGLVNSVNENQPKLDSVLDHGTSLYLTKAAHWNWNCEGLTSHALYGDKNTICRPVMQRADRWLHDEVPPWFPHAMPNAGHNSLTAEHTTIPEPKVATPICHLPSMTPHMGSTDIRQEAQALYVSSHPARPTLPTCGYTIGAVNSAFMRYKSAIEDVEDTSSETLSLDNVKSCTKSQVTDYGPLIVEKGESSRKMKKACRTSSSEDI